MIIKFLSPMRMFILATLVGNIGLMTNEPRHEKGGLQGFRSSPTQNRAVPPHKLARCLKFRI